MDRGVVLLVLALNVLAGGVLYARFSGTDVGTKFNLVVQQAMSAVFPSAHETCGLLHWDAYILISERVVLPDGVVPAAVYVENGKIHKISSDVSPTGPKVLRFKDAVIFPGVIDVHAHLNEPGREDWEGISTGTAAAAMGGITTVVDMPLNSFPVTTTAEQLKIKQQLVKEKALVDVAHWGGLIPSNAADHAALQALLDQGAKGFKCFMSPSGINDFPNVEPEDIAAALPFLKRAGVPLYAHAERVEAGPSSEEIQGDPRSYSTYEATRPPAMEQAAIKMLISLLDKDDSPASPGFSVHIAHLGDAQSLDMIKEAQKRHPLSAETVAHYLAFSNLHISDGATQFKCAPPIRSEANRLGLIDGIKSGVITMVGSDHSPAPPNLKEQESGNFLKAWGGISGIQYLLSATWTSLAPHGFDLSQLAALLSEQPARLAGLGHRKGRLAAGYDADFTIWKPEEMANTSIALNQHRHKLSPYTDLELKGQVMGTVVQGHFVSMVGGLTKQQCGKAL